MPHSPFTPGLVSITFRKLTPTQVVDLVKRSGTKGIEWGGDVHVPHGRVDVAKDVGRQTRDAGLDVAAYGSYYRAGTEAPDVFPRVLETAVALETKIIRIWAGNLGSDKADEAFRGHVVDDCRHIADLAGDAGLTIACEWHGNTLTDTAESSRRLFEAVDHRAFQTYWQPRLKMSVEANLAEMDTALPRLVGLHVFQWHEQTGERQPLSDGAAVWKRYLEKAGSVAHGGMYALIEFVKNDDLDQFLADAAALKSWLKE